MITTHIYTRYMDIVTYYPLYVTPFSLYKCTCMHLRMKKEEGKKRARGRKSDAGGEQKHRTTTIHRKFKSIHNKHSIFMFHFNSVSITSVCATLFITCYLCSHVQITEQGLFQYIGCFVLYNRRTIHPNHR